MNPTFNLQVLKSFLPIFNQRSKSIVKNIGKEVGKPAFNVLTHAEVCTLDSICGEKSKSMFKDFFFQKSVNQLLFLVQQPLWDWILI